MAQAALLLAATLGVAKAQAQTWSLPRGYPTLWQIVSIDRSGEQGFPYGREDVAGDGLGSFAAEESESDLRSVYADTDAERLWLRAYVAAENEPPPALHAFFFLDTDGRDSSGGPAHGEQLAPLQADDPTRGGYERALAVRGNGTVLGAWRWDTATRTWIEIADREPQAVRAERASARDPLGIGGQQSHGYLQVDVEHALSGLNVTCAANLFVRLVRERSPDGAFVDDAPEDFACRAPSDVYGDPVVLRKEACSNDTQCPADSRCRDGICLIGYDCGGDEDCRSGETCTDGQCVRQVGLACDAAAACDGLVCDEARCAACSESGPRACAQGLLCAPSGACLDPDRFEPGPATPDEAKVQGGALSCVAGAGRTRTPMTLACLLPLALVLLHQRVRRRRRAREADTAHELRLL